MGFGQWLERRRFAARIAREVRPERFAAFGAGAIVHPPLDVSGAERIAVGDATYVLAGARLVVAEGGAVRIGARTYLGRDLTIVCGASVEIGDDVMGSDRLLFTDVGVTADGAAPPRPVRIGDGVFLGTGAMVLAGVSVGPRCLVGAGAVVVDSVPENCVVAGNPARVVRHFDRARGEWVPGAPAAS